VTVSDPGPDGAPRIVTLLYRGGKVRIDQFDGQLEPGFIKNASGHGAVWTEVSGRTALWFADAHPIMYVDRTNLQHLETERMSGPALVWEVGAVTYRLEGIASQAEAITIAESVA
jgi:hypothetical protein